MSVRYVLTTSIKCHTRHSWSSSLNCLPNRYGVKVLSTLKSPLRRRNRTLWMNSNRSGLNLQSSPLGVRSNHCQISWWLSRNNQSILQRISLQMRELLISLKGQNSLNRGYKSRLYPRIWRLTKTITHRIKMRRRITEMMLLVRCKGSYRKPSNWIWNKKMSSRKWGSLTSSHRTSWVQARRNRLGK